MAAMKEAHVTSVVDLASLLDAGEGAVVTLEAGDTRLAAHRAVLTSRSPVFAAMFAHDTQEAGSSVVDIPDVEGPVLRQLLVYCYTLKTPELPAMAPDLLAAADKYGISQLKADCEQQVVQQLTVENAAASAVLAVRHSCPELTEAAVAFIRANMVRVVGTQGWAQAMLSQPKDLIEVSRLLAEPAPDTSTPATGGIASGSEGRTPSDVTPPDEATVSRYRSLCASEKGRRLIEASQQGAVGEVRALLAAGADVGARGAKFERWTALHFAASRGHAEVARCLLESGAEVDARDFLQQTPLHLATQEGHVAVMRLLVEASADPNARGDLRMTPLHYAAEKGQVEAAAVLLELGVDTEDIGRGWTALEMAKERNNQRLINLLEGR